MARYQADYTLVDPKTDTGYKAGWDTAQLSYGNGVMQESISRITKTYADYADNQEAYDNFASMKEYNTGASLYSEDDRRIYYAKAIESGIFDLDENGEVIHGENYFNNAEMLYDTTIIKGAILAKRNGYNEDVLNTFYSDVVREKSEALAVEREKSSPIRFALGALAGHIAQPETIIDFASPQKIIGSTILKGMGKAFAVEASLATVGEIAREKRIREHMERADLEYTLWDSVQNIMVAAGLAGSIRGIGSGVQDYATMRKITDKIPNKTDKEIFERFAQRENYKLTNNSMKHLMVLERAKQDINEGKKVNVADHLDIDINTKTDEAIEEISIEREYKDTQNINAEEVRQFEKEFDEVPQIKEATESDPYEGMTTPQEADELVSKYMDDPEIKAMYDEIEAEKARLSPQAQMAKEAKDIPVGGSEDQAKEAVKDVFKGNRLDKQFKNLSDSDIDEINKMAMEDPDMQARIKEIEADLARDLDPNRAGVGGTPVFAQFGVELFGGSMNGITYDSETGSFTFDPVRFMVGFLAGHVAKRIMANKKLNAVAKREALAYAQRTYDRLKDKPIFSYITGTHREPKGK